MMYFVRARDDQHFKTYNNDERWVVDTIDLVHAVTTARNLSKKFIEDNLSPFYLAEVEARKKDEIGIMREWGFYFEYDKLITEHGWWEIYEFMPWVNYADVVPKDYNDLMADITSDDFIKTYCKPEPIVTSETYAKEEED